MNNKLKDIDLLWTGVNGRRRGTVALYDDSMEVVSVERIDEHNNTEEEIIRKKTVQKKPKKNITKANEKKKVGCSSCGKNGLLRLIKSGAKLLKSELGIDAANEKTMAERKALCLSCPTYDFGVCVEEKGGCGCFVAAKIKLKSEACPLEKWKAVN